jgi:hypothetical protein
MKIFPALDGSFGTRIANGSAMQFKKSKRAVANIMTHKTLLAASAAISLPFAAMAQVSNPPSNSAQPPTVANTSGTSAGLVNDWLRSRSPAFSEWDFGGQFRARLEHKENFAAPGVPGAVDFRAKGGDGDNTYLLLRETVHLGYTPVSWANFLVEGRDSSSINDDRNPNIEANTFDLRQAYVRLGDPKEFPVTAKVGRQELIYGDERLIGTSDWNNIGRVFDVAKLRYENDIGWIDGFFSRVVMPDDNNFDETNDYDNFWGVYGSTRALIPKQETELYFLGRNVGQQSPYAIGTGLPASLTGASPRDIYTIGLRFKSLPGQFGGWDYEAEMAGQFGRFEFKPGDPALDHEAFAGHIAGGYTWRETWGKPRVGLEYNYASGDNNPNDNKHGTFDNLFPTNHKFYGYMDFFSWQNMHDGRLATSIKPLKQLTVTADYHAFWLANTHDFFYQVNGLPRGTAVTPPSGGYGIRPYAGSYVGSEVDLTATYVLCKYSMLQAGYGHFFIGEYVENSLGPLGGARDADYIYTQLIFNF